MEDLIFITNVHVVKNTKMLSSSHFEMEDMEKVDVIIGIKIRKTNNDFFLYVSLITLRMS